VARGRLTGTQQAGVRHSVALRPAFSITPRQQRRIVAAAEAWLADHPDDASREIRFDVILVARNGRAQHIAAAFDATP